MKIYAFIAIFIAMSFPNGLSGVGTRDSQNVQNNVLILTDDNFDKTIKKGIVLVDFYATWCGPCKVLSPIIEEIAGEIGNKAKIAKMDVDKNGKTPSKYNIRYLPTVIILKNGEVSETFVGLQTKETLMTAINELQ